MKTESTIENLIYLSIHIGPVSKIITGLKTHEFRNYIPKKEFEYIFVYVTVPIKELKYIIKVGEIVEENSKIKYEGDGNAEFNKGLITKFAYEILEVYELEKPIPLQTLKEKYKFNPPQAFAYGNKYKELSKDILNQNKKLIIKNKFKL